MSSALSTNETSSMIIVQHYFIFVLIYKFSVKTEMLIAQMLK